MATNLRRLRFAGFTAATLADVQAAANAFCRGQEVLAAVSGTIDYDAGSAGERLLVEMRYAFDGTNHCILLAYTEG